MKRRFVILALLLAPAISVASFWLRPARQTTAQTQQPVQQTNNISVPTANLSQKVFSQPTAPTSPTNSNPTSDEVQKFIQKANENYHKPIEFYGQVIDQNSNPLPDVKINLTITQEQMSSPSKDGSYPINSHIVQFEKETAADGRFELTGEWGSWLNIVSLNKPAYEEEPGDAPHNFNASIGNYSYVNPVIFKMWNTNIQEQLITGSKSFHIVPDGRPYFINLTDGTISESGDGDLKVWIKRPDDISHTRRYDWSCEVNIVNAGLCQGNSYSMFNAPTEGYIPSFQFEQKVGGGWGDSTGEKQFYVRLNNGKEYGRISLELYAHYNDQISGLIRLSYAINPSGSRILR